MTGTTNPTTAADVESVQQAFRRLSDYLEASDFRGWEYDDLLASPLVSVACGWGLYPRIAAVQVAKRFPVNVRRLLGVPKLSSTKAWGFIVKGYLTHHLATGEVDLLHLARRGLDWLRSTHSRGHAGMCWGNDFDFASRAGVMPRGLPTVVWTSHIQEAFDLAYRVLGDDAYREVVVSVGDFVENDLERMSDDTGCCIAYAPGIRHPVHNSNLLGVVALLRSWRHGRRESQRALAREALDWSLSRMNRDGSWYYGDREMLHWVDNYHTAYVLDCLCLARDIGGKELVSEDVISRTFSFWKSHFFEADGRPRFYHDRTYPTDIQATAQAIESFAKYSRRDPGSLADAAKVARWAIENMQKPNGSFRYRIYRYWRNDLEAIHWGQGTMMSALGHLLYHAQYVE